MTERSPSADGSHYWPSPFSHKFEHMINELKDKPLQNAETTATAEAFAVTGLRCQYGDFTAVDDATFSVSPGNIFALLGTNGAGKTTTVQTLQGNRRADKGQVEVLGVDPAKKWRSIAGRVAVIGQESGFADDLTVSETLKLWQQLNPKRTASPFHSNELLDVVELQHRAHIRVGALSGGEKRRLDLALAIATGPEVLFADEPTTGLDPASRQRTWEILRLLARDGCAILLTTHYLEEAEELADSVAIMHEGRIVRNGTLTEIISASDSSISFVLPAGYDLSEVPNASACHIEKSGTKVIIRTSQLQADLFEVLTWAQQRDLELHDLAARPASLEEIFTSVAHSSAKGTA